MASFELVQTLLEAEDSRLWHVAWSRDGKTLATCGSNRVCTLFRQNSSSLTFTKVAQLEDSHSRTIRACEFSPVLENGRELLATASFDATCVIWEKKTSADQVGEERWEAVATLDGHENEVKSISWSFDGLYLATCGRDKTCWVWELSQDDDENGGDDRMPNEDDDGDDDGGQNEEWRCVSVLTGHDGDVKMVRFHPNRYMFASCSYDNTVRLWDYSDAEGDFVSVAVLQGHDNTVWGCDFLTPDLLVSCSQDLTIRTWARRVQTESEEDFNEGEERWDQLFTIESAHTRTIFALDVLRESNLLITAGGDNDVIVRKVNPENGFVNEVDAVKCRNAHEQDVNCVRFRPRTDKEQDQTRIMFATAGDDGKLKLWTMSGMV